MKKNREKPVKIHLPAAFEAETDNIESSDFQKILEDVNIHSSRRNFLKMAGFSIASAAVMAACKRPVIKAIPYAIQPPELTPRIPLYYASTFFDGHEYCGVLVKTFDGRPIKIEGNSLCDFNGEGTTARVQASVLSLYDDSRLKHPEINHKQALWEDADKQIISELARISSTGGRIVLLTPSIISPSTEELIASFGSRFSDFKWIRYDAVSYSAIVEANQICFGEAVIPDYHFQNAEVVVSFNADFLGTWVAPVHFIPKYVSRRKLDDGKTDMLLHIQFESGLSLTGSNADMRKKIKPSEENALLTDLYNRIASKSGAETIPGQAFREDLTDLAEKLIASKGKSIVISGTNDTGTQIIVNGINSLLGNYGNCIDLNNHIRLSGGRDNDIEELVADLNDGKIKALIMHNVNPVYDYPDNKKFLTGLEKTELSINMSVSLNETTGKAKFECPVNHYLESWDDAEIIPGQLSLAQPGINPLFDTRSFQDSLLKWSENASSWHDYLVSAWEKKYFPASGIGDFKTFWNTCLGNGVYKYPVALKSSPSFSKDSFNAIKPAGNTITEGFEVIISESVAIGTGMHANNPWLMELPDPVSRHSWENVASISGADAARLGIVNGQIMKLAEGLSLPALIQPGQADGTISVALGYGHTGAGQVAADKGANAYPFVTLSGGNRIYSFSISNPVVSQEIIELALMQLHSSMEGRPIVRETVLSSFRENPSSGNELHEEFEREHKSLYPDVKFDGFHWAMVIDLNACIGCNTCVIACQAENNTPTVGRDEVRRNRIMHWIKIHRYYSDDQENPKVYFQPVFCQHCDNAPCENVCPVSATNHSNEGLNQMSYNRCVGTKYCINNCPYRVRRFNWFRYTNNKAFDYNTASDLGRLVLNPDVTVRERGVVEKCTFCVQRIQAKKLQAKLEKRVLKDNEIKTACMQACPAGAIVFGDLNDSNSRVSQLMNQPRRYQLLEELHTLPSIGFLTKVRNEMNKA